MYPIYPKYPKILNINFKYIKSMKVLHIRLPESEYILWREYASHFKNYREAVKNIPYIKDKLQGKLIIEPKKSRKI